MLLSLAIASLSMHWPHTLTYDPWSWALWGREIIHGSLNTAGGSSWKPLPVVFDSFFSLFGNAAPDLWLILARAGSLMSLVLGYRLAARVAGPLAGAATLVWIVFSAHSGFVFGWLTFFGPGWSEGLLVAVVLGAVEAHVEGRPRIALAAWFAAALIRPEAAVFLLMYAGFVARRDPTLRVLAASLLLAVPVLWLIPDYLGSGKLLLGSSRALNDVPSSLRRSQHPGLRDVTLLRDLLSPPVLVGAALALALSRALARRLVLMLLGLAIAWLVVIGIMAEAGYPGIPRFLVVSVWLFCVLAGIGWGLLMAIFTRLPIRVLTLAAVVAINTLFLVGQLSDLRHQSAETSYESRLNAQLTVAISRAGGASAVRRCGVVSTNPLEIPAVSWDLGYGAGVTSRVLHTGVILRTRIYGQHTVLPRVPAPAAGFTLTARVKDWSVYARCRRAHAPALHAGLGVTPPSPALT